MTQLVRNESPPLPGSIPSEKSHLDVLHTIPNSTSASDRKDPFVGRKKPIGNPRRTYGH